MHYRRLGRTGLKVSELCLGTMQFGWTTDEPNSVAVMESLHQLTKYPKNWRPIWD